MPNQDDLPEMMTQDESRPTTNGTGRHVIVDIGSHMRLIRWGKIIGGTVAALLLAGFSGAAYFYHNFAQASDLQQTNARQVAISDGLGVVRQDQAATKAQLQQHDDHLKAHDELFKSINSELEQILQNQIDEQKWERGHY